MANLSDAQTFVWKNISEMYNYKIKKSLKSLIEFVKIIWISPFLNQI